MKENDAIERSCVLCTIEKFKGYLDEDMIYRIKIAINRLSAVPQPMDAIEFRKQFNRMCKQYKPKDYRYLSHCPGCPVDPMPDRGYSETCSMWCKENFAELVALVEEWTLLHPEGSEI